MPSTDKVQIVPGKPAIFARVLSTSWQQLPDVPHCISVFLRPRPGGSASIYVATENNAGALNRLELAAADPGLSIDTDTPANLWVRGASGTPTIEVVCLIGVR